MGEGQSVGSDVGAAVIAETELDKILVYRVYVGSTVASFEDLDIASAYATAQAKEFAAKNMAKDTFYLESVRLTREKYLEEVEQQEAGKAE